MSKNEQLKEKTENKEQKIGLKTRNPTNPNLKSYPIGCGEDHWTILCYHSSLLPKS
jgi:hypothetical protein